MLRLKTKQKGHDGRVSQSQVYTRINWVEKTPSETRNQAGRQCNHHGIIAAPTSPATSSTLNKTQHEKARDATQRLTRTPPRGKSMNDQLLLELQASTGPRLARLIGRLVRQVHSKPPDTALIVAFTVLPFFEERHAIVPELAPPGCHSSPESSDTGAGSIDFLIFSPASRW
jgi:hypothetical protein